MFSLNYLNWLIDMPLLLFYNWTQTFKAQELCQERLLMTTLIYKLNLHQEILDMNKWEMLVWHFGYTIACDLNNGG